MACKLESVSPSDYSFEKGALCSPFSASPHPPLSHNALILCPLRLLLRDRLSLDEEHAMGDLGQDE